MSIKQELAIIATTIKNKIAMIQLMSKTFAKVQHDQKRLKQVELLTHKLDNIKS